MRMDVVPFQRLLDHQQFELIELAKMVSVFEAIGRVGVDRKQNSRKLFPNGGNEIEILPRFDLELDALVSAGEFIRNLTEQRFRCFANSKGNAASNLLLRAPH